MGNCSSTDNVTVAAPATTALLQLPPQPNLVKLMSLASPKAGKRNEGGCPTKDVFVLDDLSRIDNSRPIPVSQVIFLSMIQRKSRKPIDYVLIDLQSRTEHNRNTIKFSICLWENNAVSDTANDRTRSDIINTLKSKCTNKTILIFDSSENPAEGKNVQNFSNVLEAAQVAYKNVYLLEVSMKIFCKRYAHCYSKSSLSLPGPTEILWTDNPGFCLYLADAKTLRFNLGVLTDVHDIRVIINVAGEPGSAQQNPNTNIQIISIPQVDCPNRGVWYARAVEQLSNVASRGLPTLVIDGTGDKHAPAICALFLVSLGWDPAQVIKHIELRRGPPRTDDTSLFDAETVRALSKLADNDTQGAIGEYAQWKDEPLSSYLQTKN